MYERDYILRLITEVGRMLQSMLQAIREHRPDDALETAREAVTALMDTDVTLIDTMTGAGLVTFLSAGGSIDVLRSRMLGEILIARAEAYDAVGRSAAAEHERSRAITVLRAARSQADGEERDRIEELLTGLR